MVKSSPLEYLLNNIFLPPKLPQYDGQTEKNDDALCQFVWKTAREFQNALRSDEKVLWKPVQKMLEHLAVLMEDGGFNTATVKDLLGQMRDGGMCRDIWSLHPIG
jgi:hypothetical protein